MEQVIKITGTLTAPQTITGELCAAKPIVGTLTPTMTISGTLSSSTYWSGETYDGIYTVIPKARTEQSLMTRGLQMTNDVTVTAVPYWETGNETGYTVYIAEDTDGE